jgi:hypothetical protein
VTSTGHDIRITGHEYDQVFQLDGMLSNSLKVFHFQVPRLRKMTAFRLGTAKNKQRLFSLFSIFYF